MDPREAAPPAEFFRKLANHVRVPLYIIRGESFIYVNPAFGELFGYRPGEIVGHLTPIDLVYPPDREKVREYMRRRLRGGHPVVRYTARGVRRDGSVFVGEVRGCRLTGGGEPLIAGAVIDLSRNLRLARALRARVEHYLNVLRAIDDAIITLDEGDRVVEWSHRAQELFGHNARYVLGKDIRELVPEDERERLAEVMRTLRAAAREGRPVEIVCQKGDNTLVTEVAAARWASVNGPRLTVVVRDVTARKRAFSRLERLLEEVARAFSVAVETRDPYTARHQVRVAELARAIGRELGWSGERLRGLYFGGLLHDLGKISVPAEILAKPAALTATERALVQQHTVAGYEILKQVEFPWPVAEMALQHHERLDGSGYPQGLKGEEIIPEARILAVADVVEAIAHHRPYRPSFGLEAALEEIEGNRGTLYDPAAVDACLMLFREKGFRFPD